MTLGRDIPGKQKLDSSHPSLLVFLQLKRKQINLLLTSWNGGVGGGGGRPQTGRYTVCEYVYSSPHKADPVTIQLIMNALWPQWSRNTWWEVPWEPKAEKLEVSQESRISHNPGGAPSLFLPGYCKEKRLSYKMMISFQRSSELPIRFPVFLVSLGSPSTATSTNELIRGWRLCTLGFADTTGQERKKKSKMSQKAPSCPPVADVLALF